MDKNYMFISYSHRNSSVVLSIVRHLLNNGFLCWIDYCIHGGSRWRKVLADKIDGCSCCVLFLSKSYIESSNCKEEWEYAKSCSKNILQIYIDDVELPNDMKMALNPYQFLKYDGSDIFWDKFEKSVGISECKYDLIDSDLQSVVQEKNDSVFFESNIRSLIQWLTNIPCRWGVLESSREPQHANTCEGLLAMKLAGYDVVKKWCYYKAWSYICKEVSEFGLTSKSLGRETVVCTSQFLLIASMERNNLSELEIKKFEGIAKHLWHVRNEEYGWGVYMELTDRENCSYANTAWALRALCEYTAIRESDSFKNFCEEIFESECDGLFSYFRGGLPKLMVTAMYLGLYYRMDDEWKKRQNSIFNKTASIDYIFRMFVENNVQFEMETIFGINQRDSGPKKVPWNHITVWPVLDALSMAYYNGDLSEEQWRRLHLHMKKILDKNVRKAGNLFCYHPEGMEESRNGYYTFPSSYLVMGLCQLLNTDILRGEEKNVKRD